MKVIPLSKAKAQLSKYARLCRQEPVIVTINGQPSFELVPLDEDDDLINQLLEHNPKFVEMLQKRLKEPSIPAAEAARRLGRSRS